jgi:D-alanyl-D-alanine carboxypeptidase
LKGQTPFNTWISREIVGQIGLLETYPDYPDMPASTPFARGHTARALLGERLPILADPTHDMASATGFVSTPSDLALFFTSLDPASPKSPLTPTSRREMTRRHWKIPHLTPDSYYGLGTSSGTIGTWEHFGHGGAFQGVFSPVSADDVLGPRASDGLDVCWTWTGFRNRSDEPDLNLRANEEVDQKMVC